MGVNLNEMLRMSGAIRQFGIAGAGEFARGVLELNNQGGDGAPPAPIDTGELRGSPRLTVNSPSNETSPANGPYPLTSPADAARAVQLGGFDLGDTLWIRWIAGHASLLETHKRSRQAPGGWVLPAIETQTSRQRRWKFRGGVR